MKKNNKKSNAKQPNIQVTFSASELTQFSGLLPLHTLITKLNLPSLLNSAIQLDVAKNMHFKTSQILLTTLLGILSGQNRIDKIEQFSQDPLVRQLMNLDRVLDADTINYRFRKFNFQTCEQFSQLIGGLSKKIHSTLQTESDILDLDSSVRTVYGRQEGAAKGFNPTKKGAFSYHPLLAFLNSTKECLNAWLRPGNSYTANNAPNFLRDCLRRLNSHLKRLLVRMDSGFFDNAVLEVLEQWENKDLELTYIIKAKLTPCLQRCLESQSWQAVEGQPQFESSAFSYRADGWEKMRSFVAVRRKKEEIQDTLFPYTTYDYFCYVTNRSESAFCTHKVYGNRGESENWIEAVKNQMFGGSFLVDSFWANEAFFLCSVLAYNLSIWFRLLTDEKTWHEEPATFRNWFIVLAGKMVRTGRTLVLKVYKWYYERDNWLRLYERMKGFQFG